MHLIFIRAYQRQQYFENVKKQLDLPWKNIAELLGVSLRTLYDWRTGRYSFSVKAADIIYQKFKISLPKRY